MFSSLKALAQLDLGFSRNGNRFTMPAIMEAGMKLEIVWRNPFSVRKIEHTLRRIRADEQGATYSVSNRDLTQEFELIQGAA